MSDLSISVDSHQLFNIIGSLEKAHERLVMRNEDFFVCMGSKATHVVPNLIEKLRAIQSTTGVINMVTSRMNNTTKVTISGNTLLQLDKVLVEFLGKGYLELGLN